MLAGGGSSPASNGKRRSPGRLHLDSGRLGRAGNLQRPAPRGMLGLGVRLCNLEAGVGSGAGRWARLAGFKRCLGPLRPQGSLSSGNPVDRRGKLELIGKREREMGMRGRSGGGRNLYLFPSGRWEARSGTEVPRETSVLFVKAVTTKSSGRYGDFP